MRTLAYLCALLDGRVYEANSTVACARGDHGADVCGVVKAWADAQATCQLHHVLGPGTRLAYKHNSRQRHAALASCAKSCA